MATSDEWFIYIKDRDRKQFALAGPVQGKFVDDWINAVVRERDTDRALSGEEVTGEQLAECRSHARNNGLSEVESTEIISIPRDRSSDYFGKLPEYASKADRSKAVQLLCKGKCSRSSWAEMNKPYPGEEVLRKGSMGEYKATCLRCGSVASDNYNWHR